VCEYWEHNLQMKWNERKEGRNVGTKSKLIMAKVNEGKWWWMETGESWTG
jgi:hypothetical protein